MKTLKSTVLSLLLLVVFMGSKTMAGMPYAALSREAAINVYLNAVVHGRLNGIEEAIDEGASFNMIRGPIVNTLNKNQILSYLKSIENTEQNCTTTTKVIKEGSDFILTKLEMRYNNLTRTDIITLTGSGKKWKITKVDTSFS